MRATLVFPPLASPTYVPLGLQHLAAVTPPGTTLALVDANVLAWDRVASADPEEPARRAALRGASGAFYDPEGYGPIAAVRARTEEVLRRETAILRRRLAEGLDLSTFADRVLEDALASDPELLGISVLCLDQLPWALAIALAARRRLGARARIALGGACTAALHPAELLAACPALDAVVTGPGEEAWRQLCLEAPLDAVPGAWVRTPGGARRIPPPAASPLPAADPRVLPLDRYWNPEPVVPLLFGRGCQWRRCRFCAHTHAEPYRQTLAAHAFAAHLETLSRDGIRHVYFADLYVPPKALDALALALAERGCDVRFHVLGRPVGAFTAERLHGFYGAGCRWVSWGIESGSQRLLDIAGKGTRLSTVRRVLQDSHGAGLANLGFFIFGLPGSGDGELEETLRFLEEIVPFLDVVVASPFTLMEGTAFAERAEAFGLLVDGPEVELSVGGTPVHSRRLRFRERDAQGQPRPPRGPVELQRWLQRKRWIGPDPFWESLPAEHFLLHAARRADARARPGSRPPRKAA